MMERHRWRTAITAAVIGAVVGAVLATVVFVVIASALFQRSSVESVQPQKFYLDGCTYVLDPDYAPIEGWDSSVVDNIMHDDSNCRMPLHWSHVLQDTSFYARLRQKEHVQDSLDSLYNYEMR